MFSWSSVYYRSWRDMSSWIHSKSNDPEWSWRNVSSAQHAYWYIWYIQIFKLHNNVLPVVKGLRQSHNTDRSVLIIFLQDLFTILKRNFTISWMSHQYYMDSDIYHSVKYLSTLYDVIIIQKTWINNICSWLQVM